MSGKIMGGVWDLDLPRNKTIILLAMADHADHQGKNIYPSIGLIAWKTGYSESQTRRVIQALVKDGILKKTIRPGKTTMYEVDLSAGTLKKPYREGVPEQSDPVHSDDTPQDPCHNGDTPSTQMTPPPLSSNDTPAPVTQMTPEPSFEPSFEPSVRDGAANVITPDGSEWMRTLPGIHTVTARLANVNIKATNLAVATTVKKHGSELVLKAIEIAVMKDKRTWSFVVGCLLTFEKDRLKQENAPKPPPTISPAIPDDPDRDVVSKEELVRAFDKIRAAMKQPKSDTVSANNALDKPA